VSKSTGRREWFGTITDLGPPLQVRLEGDDEAQPATRNGSGYPSPAVNDRVAVLRIGAQLYVQGTAVQ